MKLSIKLLCVISICALSAVMVFTDINVFAHSGAKGIVKVRMNAMKAIGAQMKKMGKIAKDPTKFDAKLVNKAAAELEQHAAKIPDLFPNGTNHKPSEARNEIWSDWDKFVSYANDLTQSAGELQKVSAEEFKPVFLKAAKTCVNCHQEFRVKKN